MSISNLLTNNDLDLKAKSVTASTINADNITFNSFDFVQSSSGTQSIVIPEPSDKTDVTTFGVADSIFSATGETFNIAIDSDYNVVVKTLMSVYNNHATATRSAGIGFQFQNDDDSWDTTSNLPYMWNVVHPESGVTLTLLHKLNAGHGYKAVRLMVGSQEGTDVTFGRGASLSTQQNYSIIEVHSSL